ncbi:subclass B3 metallo-beta-lactamase [Sphingomicrobium aestuariivivum]|uniref:subclass B3 metallo-beta-lactamase n=1 Tax=Sphingomicrobium aestuariivivum TaxID=1582356 RepID=UPI001FD6F345|nr:subclass B3 metallo-beta-lactamase [Sphingomicrobium aestuariivivum]MCJ8190824.1 subclass B3 metallo-beta-lactamase [Sphingomicrobium aestuariivivum]
MSAKRIALLASLPILLAGCTITTVSSGTPAEEAPRFFEAAAYGEACGKWDDWDKPAPPVRVYGGTYLVGTCGITSVLVTSHEGHMLIDSGTERGAELVLANLETVGVSPKHIYWMSHSHEHHDHVGGMAKLKAQTQARVISGTAAEFLELGTLSPDDPQFGMHGRYDAVDVDDLLVDGEQVAVGDTVLTMYETPGHSPGALTWTWEECEASGCLTIVYADSLSAVSRDGFAFTDNPQLLAAYRDSIDLIEQLDCDILLTPHPSASGMVSRMRTGNLVDATACATYAGELRDKLEVRIAEETGEMLEERMMETSVPTL